MTLRRLAFGLIALTAFVFGQERTDYNLMHLIREEASEHSQVMDHLEHLTDRYGPRLTASPEFDEAAGWTMERMKSWGLANVHTESWGPFGRSWSLKHYAVEMVEPRHVIGRSTVESIESGTLYGFAAQVDGLARRFMEELGPSTVVATGGLSSLIAPHSDTIEHVEPWLTLHGLRIVFDRNVSGGAA